MEIEKIRNLSDDELKAQQIKSAEELFRLRFRMKLGNPEGVKKLRGLKLDIARIKTVERERELHIEREAKPEKAAAVAASEAKPAKKAAAKTAAKKAPAKKAATKKATKKD
ncbi:MAG TPA: 50S ribosomal protein L29 [Acidobacteriaceae bacterium]|nr:50S ribosomal protein L29 [Acidobacteriaceae bacterium]